MINTLKLAFTEQKGSQCVLLTEGSSITLHNIQPAVNSVEEEGGGRGSLTFRTFYNSNLDTVVDVCLTAI